MKRLPTVASALLVATAFLFNLHSCAAEDPVVQAATEAANRLIQSVSTEQQKALLFDFDDDQQRHRWSNLPVGISPRKGLRMGDLTKEQQDAVIGLLAATLSPSGVRQIQENRNGDEMLTKSGGGNHPGAGRGPGGSGGPGFGKDNYFISILGSPSTTEPWMWQFGGHHLAINATLAQDNITLSPSLTGGQPVDFEFDGVKVRQLAEEEDLSFELIGSLSNEQRTQAVLDDHHADMIWGPGREGAKPKKEGIQASALRPDQQKQLLELIRSRIGLVHDSHAAQRMKKIESELDETYFARFGPTQTGSAASFRIQGPTVLIEYAPQHLGGDDTNHTHAMYRDPTNDYGSEIIESSSR